MNNKIILIDGKTTNHSKKVFEKQNLLIENKLIKGIGYIPDDNTDDFIDCKNHLIIQHTIDAHRFSPVRSSDGLTGSTFNDDTYKSHNSRKVLSPVEALSVFNEIRDDEMCYIYPIKNAKDVAILDFLIKKSLIICLPQAHITCSMSAI